MKRWSTVALCAALSSVGGCYSGLGDDARADGSAGEDAGDDDGADGGTADDDGADDGAGDDAAPEGYEPGAVSLRLLLGHQYTTAIADLLGPQAAAAAAPPADIALNGFSSIGAAQLALGDVAIDAYEDSARAVAAAAVSDPANVTALVGCVPAGPTDAACFEQFIVDFGRLAFRRPLAADEVAQWVAVATTAATDTDSFEWGVQAVLSGMLQSPYFMYQVEVGEPDPNTTGVLRLTGYEMATRLSFFLLGTTPDEALLQAAADGTLDTADGVRMVAAELLTRPEAAQALQTFVGEVFRLRDLGALPKDNVAFPTFDSALAAAMEQETQHFVRYVWQQGGDFRDLFDADYTFVNDVMAAHYGIPGEFTADFVKVDLPPEQKRGGILGHASVLSLLAHVSTTSPTLRGKFIRENVLCQSIPPPPPGVVTDLPESGGATVRERLELHMSEPSCAACHTLMDPLGFGLETYDGIGSYRTMENGVVIDDNADVNGVPFAGAKALGAILKEDPSSTSCLLRNLYRHGSGHLETPDEFGELTVVADGFADDGYQLDNALAELVASPAFRFVGSPQ